MAVIPRPRQRSRDLLRVSVQSCSRISSSASSANWLPWRVAAGNPPSACEICSAVMWRISSMVLPTMSSVRSEALAIAALQPRVRNRAAAIRPFSMRTASRNSSPQTGLVTFTVLVASGRSPALRGCSQCSSTTALYMIRVSQSDRPRATWCGTLIEAAQTKTFARERTGGL